MLLLEDLRVEKDNAGRLLVLADIAGDTTAGGRLVLGQVGREVMLGFGGALRAARVLEPVK